MPNAPKLPGFPRSTDRGLIEALANASTRATGALFPRSTDRGLIEAAVAWFRRSAVRDHFRDQLIAASLKPVARRECGQLEVEFPRSTDRGLIEAIAVNIALATVALISAIN